MKKATFFIGIIILVIVTAIIGLVMLFSWWKYDDIIETENTIELDTSMWITPLIKYNINDTEDTFEIINEVGIPENKKGETVSFSQIINYTVSIDGVEYQGSFIFNSSSDGIIKNEDNNPNYNVELTNYRNNSVFVKITKI